MVFGAWSPAPKAENAPAAWRVPSLNLGWDAMLRV